MKYFTYHFTKSYFVAKIDISRHHSLDCLQHSDTQRFFFVFQKLLGMVYQPRGYKSNFHRNERWAQDSQSKVNATISTLQPCYGLRLNKSWKARFSFSCFQLQLTIDSESSYARVSWNLKLNVGESAVRGEIQEKLSNEDSWEYFYWKSTWLRILLIWICAKPRNAEETSALADRERLQARKIPTGQEDESGPLKVRRYPTKVQRHKGKHVSHFVPCLLYTSPSPRDA